MMKTMSNQGLLTGLFLCFFWAISSTAGFAQKFQKVYGNNLENYFHKVIPEGQNYYVLGNEDNYGTVSHVLSNGQLDWTIRFIAPCLLLDAAPVFTGVGQPPNLMVVGLTLPFDNTNKSLLAIVTPTGGLIHTQEYDNGGNEGFVRIAPNPSGTFAVTGFVNSPAASNNVLLLNVNGNGMINSANIYGNSGDNGYFYDVEIMGVDQFVAGYDGNAGVIFRLDNSFSPAFLAGVRDPSVAIFVDLAIDGAEVIAAGSPAVAGGLPLLRRFDANLLPIWTMQVANIDAIQQVEVSPVNGDIYAVGTKIIGGTDRAVVIRIDDSGVLGPKVVWAKYLDNGENAHATGYITLLSSGNIALADGKTGVPNGFGLGDAFLAVTDDNLKSYCTRLDSVALIPDMPFLEGPQLDFLDFTSLNPVSPLDFNGAGWQQAHVCFDPTPILECAHVRTFVEPDINERVVWLSGDEVETGFESLTYSPPSGSVFPLGTTPVTCTAVTASGDTITCSFNVEVQKLPSDSLQPPVPVTAGEYFDRVRDHYGNPYRLSDLQIPETMSGSLLCTNAGYFNLFFEPGCGMDGNSAVEVARRDVICQVFSDLSKFIEQPNPANPAKVNIWVRNILDPSIGANLTFTLGVGSSFYTMPAGAPNLGGIVDGEVWKTINSGVDSYTGMSSPLTSFGFGAGFYHGFIAFNFANPNIGWHTDLSPSNPTLAGLYDLYSIALHEATHALGFASLIGPSGLSVLGGNFTKYYSRYDDFLEAPNGQPLITNAGACGVMYNYQFNPALSPAVLYPPNSNSSQFIPDHTECPTAIQFDGLPAVKHEVYTPNFFQGGSSLSHFEDECPNPLLNNKVYVMSNANGAGASYMKRYLKPEERQVLCRLGYRVKDTYGNTSQLTYFNYQTSVCPGLGVAGVNDGITSNGLFAYSTMPGMPITINNILANDYQAQSYECLQVIFGGGNAIPLSSTAFTYQPGTNAGLVLLRYVPVGFNGNRGNITYILIHVKKPGCLADPCGMVGDPGFEQAVSCWSPMQPACWETLSATPDLYARVCNDPTLTLNSSVYPDTWNGAPNNHYLGLWASRDPTFEHTEAVQTTLATPIIAGQYTVSFRARMQFPTSGVATILIGASPGTLPATVFFSPVLNTAGVQTLIPAITVPNNGTWNQMIATFNYQGTTPLNNLIVANYLAGTSSPGSHYVYIDDIQIFPQTTTPVFTPPSPLCNNASPVNLSLNNIVSIPGGAFTGSPCLINGTDFDPACAGIGAHVIAYTVIDANGCPSTVTATIQVIAGPTVTFDVSSVVQPVCLNAAPISLNNLASPPGGVFSGPGVTYNSATQMYEFFPGNAGLGAVTLTYAYAGGGCPLSIPATIQVVPCTDICEITNNCLDLDGALPPFGDFVLASNPLTTPALQNNFSVACWFRDDRLPNAPPDGYLYRLFGFAWTGPRFEVGDQDNLLTFYSPNTGIVQSVNIRDGKWHHLAAVKNGNLVTIYLDAVAVMTNLNVGTFNGTAQSFHIGDWAGGGNIPRFWQGRVDEFKVWGASLVASQIRDEMLCGLDPNNANLLTHFPFDQYTAFGNNAGNTGVVNVVTGNVEGTLVNFTLNGVSSNWVARGRDRLPNCNPDHFAWLEGNPGRNFSSRSKVYDADIFTIGSEVLNGVWYPTFTRRGPDGVVKWRTRIPQTGYFNDFIRTDEGCYLLVGQMPKYQGDNYSIIARIDQNGNLDWLHQHNFAERESLTRIIRSDNPDNPQYPYVICGIRKNAGTSIDDVLLLTIDNQGTINWLREIGNKLPLPTDDNFCFDLINYGGGYALTGTYDGNVLPLQRPVLFITNNLGLQLASSSQYQNGIVFYAVEPALNGQDLYLAGLLTSGDAVLAKVDAGGTPVWALQFPSVKVFRKIIVRPSGDIFALGERDHVGAYRNVVVKTRDFGNSAAALWQKHAELSAASNWPNTENNWTPADLTWYSGKMFFFTDSRVNNSNGWGNEDIGAVLYNLDQTPDICPFTSETPVSQNLTLNRAALPALANILVTPTSPTVTTAFSPLMLPADSLCPSLGCACNFIGLAFYRPGPSGWYKPVSACGLAPVALPGCPGQTTPIRLLGQLKCTGGCAFSGLSWVLTGPSSPTPIASGTSSTPSFSNNITLAMVQTPGIYTYTITGQCGSKTCQCTVQFIVPACPPPCTCAQPGFTNAVNAGFNWVQLPGCKFQFTPKSLTTCDAVTWKVAVSGSNNFTTFANSSGNQTVTYTFPATDQYVVCMTVVRTPPGGATPCQVSRCWTLNIDCSLFRPGENGTDNFTASDACSNSIVENGGFTVGAEAGGLADIGTAWNWNYSAGNPEVVTEAGNNDVNYVRLRGNQGHSDLIYQDSLVLTPWDSTEFTMAFRPIHGLVLPGTELVVRLSAQKQDSVWCNDDSTCLEILRLPVPELDSSQWLLVGSYATVRNTALPFLTIHIENPFVDDDVALKSMVDIDNICLSLHDIVSIKPSHEEAIRPRLFPNPTMESVTLQLSGRAPASGAIQLFDLYGRLLRTEALPANASMYTFSVAALPAGIYFVTLHIDGVGLMVERLIKQ